MSVCCPSCGSRHVFRAAAHPCACGAPVAPILRADAPAEPVTHRAWADEWVTVRCAACGRDGDWPRPELGCPCGTALRIPVAGAGTDPVPPGAPQPARAPHTERPAHIPLPRTGRTPRPPFRPTTIRTSQDAVTAAALYLRWLGFKSVVRAGTVPSPGGPEDTGVDLRGPDVVAQVDPTTSPASLRAVECLWLNGLGASTASVYFALAGYAEDARSRADALGLPLFAMDLTGTPQPVNGPAAELVSAGP
ncbi:hypothetical protein DVH02_21295 [Streptomyces corynorhini]|uniref:Restriction endonuclease type IV Mrr domain-containing protein n=1 Tax=Streptomyces corynorhini TaxID=2282652 RepID=A0A370B6C1_9ACTN|nr:hypothetical protein DVH02_21295 [Streptomyces corynorhini]